MAFHHCTIALPDGQVVARDVTVSLQQTLAEGVQKWYGTLTVTHLAALEAGQRYRLTLDDGRSGEFMVRRNTFAGETNRAVAIDGVGPLAPPP
jgi:hypothetical protein